MMHTLAAVGTSELGIWGGRGGGRTRDLWKLGYLQGASGAEPRWNQSAHSATGVGRASPPSGPVFADLRCATVGLDRRSATACRRGWLPCRVIAFPGRTSGRASGRVLSTYFQRISAIVGWAFFPPGIASRGPGAMRVPDWPMVTVAGLRPGEKRRVCYNGNPARRSHLL